MMTRMPISLSDSLKKFVSLVQADTSFVYHFYFEGGIPVIVFSKAESRFRSSQLFRDLRETGINFKFISRRNYNDGVSNK